MKTIIVPVDFSENALNAAQYAIAMMPHSPASRLIVYHSRNEEKTPDTYAKEQFSLLEEQVKTDDDLEFLYISDDKPLIEGISDLVDLYRVDMIVMGMTGRNKVGQRVIGSQVFQVSQSIRQPVLIVPAQTVFNKIKNIALTLPMVSDLKNNIPHEEIKSFVRTTGGKLLVVNVARDNDKTSKSVLFASLSDIFELFDELEPSYHFLTGRNTVQSITDFAGANEADLLISISGKYSFVQGLFRTSVSKSLAYDANIPLLLYNVEYRF